MKLVPSYDASFTKEILASKFNPPEKIGCKKKCTIQYSQKNNIFACQITINLPGKFFNSCLDHLLQ